MSAWIKGLRIINKALFAVILVGGIIGGMVAGFAIGGFGGFLSFVSISAGSYFLAFMSVALLMTFLDMAEDISVIAGEVKRSKSFGNISSVKQEQAFFDEAQARKQAEHEKALLKDGGWKCKSCGKINPRYTGTCGCGRSRYAD